MFSMIINTALKDKPYFGVNSRKHWSNTCNIFNKVEKIKTKFSIIKHKLGFDYFKKKTIKLLITTVEYKNKWLLYKSYLKTNQRIPLEIIRNV